MDIETKINYGKGGLVSRALKKCFSTSNCKWMMIKNAISRHNNVKSVVKRHQFVN